MRRTITLLAATLLTLGIMAAPALAWHQHELENPGTTVTFRCEPAHLSGTPQNPGVHPIHFGLHNAIDPAVVDERGNPGPVSVRATGTPCPAE